MVRQVEWEYLLNIPFAQIQKLHCIESYQIKQIMRGLECRNYHDLRISENSFS
eukprot:403335482